MLCRITTDVRPWFTEIISLVNSLGLALGVRDRKAKIIHWELTSEI